MWTDGGKCSQGFGYENPYEVPKRAGGIIDPHSIVHVAWLPVASWPRSGCEWSSACFLLYSWSMYRERRNQRRFILSRGVVMQEVQAVLVVQKFQTAASHHVEDIVPQRFSNRPPVLPVLRPLRHLARQNLNKGGR